MWGTPRRKDHQADGDGFTVLGKNVTFKGIARFDGTSCMIDSSLGFWNTR
jgi:hypothetical protein